MAEEPGDAPNAAGQVPVDSCEACGAEVRIWSLATVGGTQLCPSCRSEAESAERRTLFIRLGVLVLVGLTLIAAVAVFVTGRVGQDGAPQRSIYNFTGDVESGDEQVISRAYDRYTDIGAITDQLKVAFEARRAARGDTGDVSEAASVVGHNLVVLGVTEIKQIEVSGDTAYGTATFTAPCVTNLGKKFTVKFVLSRCSDEQGTYWRVVGVENPAEVVDVYLDD